MYRSSLLSSLTSLQRRVNEGGRKSFSDVRLRLLAFLAAAAAAAAAASSASAFVCGRFGGGGLPLSLAALAASAALAAAFSLAAFSSCACLARYSLQYAAVRCCSVAKLARVRRRGAGKVSVSARRLAFSPERTARHPIWHQLKIVGRGTSFWYLRQMPSQCFVSMGHLCLLAWPCRKGEEGNCFEHVGLNEEQREVGSRRCRGRETGGGRERERGDSVGHRRVRRGVITNREGGAVNQTESVQSHPF